jgi:DNA primase
MTYREDIGGKLIAYFKKRLALRNYKNGWLKGDCPHCGKLDKFGVNVGRDKTNCFSCGEQMKPMELILFLEGLPTRKELYTFIRNLTDTDPFESFVKPLEQKEVKLPESFTLLSLGEGFVANLARKYVKGRGFKVERMAMKGWGYCSNGDYGGCIIIPFFTQGELQYFIGRRFINNGEKFKNPPMEEFGVGRNKITYNRDALLYYSKVQVVESAINAETIGDTAIGTLGKSISDYQFSDILRSPVTHVEILLDPDAYLQALKTAMKLADYKKVKVVKLPEEQDVNDIGKKETKKLRDSTPWLGYQDLFKLYNFEKNRLEYEQNN